MRTGSCRNSRIGEMPSRSRHSAGSPLACRTTAHQRHAEAGPDDHADTVLVGASSWVASSSRRTSSSSTQAPQSDASPGLFRVYLVSGPAGIAEQETGGGLLRVNGAPWLRCRAGDPEASAADTGELRLLDGPGRLVRTW